MLNGKMYYRIINVSISIFIVLIIIILIIISFTLSDFDEIDSMSSGNNTDVTTFIKKDYNTNDQAIFKQEFKNFINLFTTKDFCIKDKKHVHKINDTLSFIENHGNQDDKYTKIQGSVNPEIATSVIINKVYHLNYDSANREIEVLKDRISILEVQFIKDKINLLDTEKLIDSIIKDINKQLRSKIIV